MGLGVRETSKDKYTPLVCTFPRPSCVQKTRLTNESEVSSPSNRRISVLMCGWWCWASQGVLSFGPKSLLFRRCPRPSGIRQAPYDPGKRCTLPRQRTLVCVCVCVCVCGYWLTVRRATASESIRRWLHQRPHPHTRPHGVCVWPSHTRSDRIALSWG